MNQDDAFLQAILESPDDDTPRLVYSDWLTEQGDSRGAFIRVQCQLARLPEDDPRRDSLELEEAELLPAIREALRQRKPPDWARKIPASARMSHLIEFERGFPARLNTSPGRFLKEIDALMRATPLQHVRLPGARRAIQAIAACPHLARLRSLDLSHSKLGNEGLPALLASTHIGGLRKLALAGNNLLVAGVSALAKAPRLAGLTALELGLNRVFDAGVESIASSSILANLESLSLPTCQVGVRGATALSRSKTLQRLAALDLSRNRIGNKGAEALAHADLPALTSINLIESKVTSVGAQQLLAGSLPCLRRLELGDPSLELDVWRITPTPLLHGRLHLTLRSLWHDRPAALAHSPLLAACVGLRLHGCDLGDEGAAILARSPETAGLTELDLSGNRIGPVGLRELTNSPHLSKVTRLSLPGNTIEEWGLSALLDSPLATQLAHLDLRFTNLGNDDYSALTRRALGNLTRLILNASLPQSVQQELQERFGARVRFG